MLFVQNSWYGKVLYSWYGKAFDYMKVHDTKSFPSDTENLWYKYYRKFMIQWLKKPGLEGIMVLNFFFEGFFKWQLIAELKFLNF